MFSVIYHMFRSFYHHQAVFQWHAWKIIPGLKPPLHTLPRYNALQVVFALARTLITNYKGMKIPKISLRKTVFKISSNLGATWKLYAPEVWQAVSSSGMTQKYYTFPQKRYSPWLSDLRDLCTLVWRKTLFTPFIMALFCSSPTEAIQGSQPTNRGSKPKTSE